MESGVNTRPEDFIEEVPRIVKSVGVQTVLESQAVDDNMHLRSAEVGRNQV